MAYIGLEENTTLGKHTAHLMGVKTCGIPMEQPTNHWHSMHRGHLSAYLTKGTEVDD